MYADENQQKPQIWPVSLHLLKLVDKMCKYEMDLASNVEDTEWARFCSQADRRTDWQGETSMPPPSTSLKQEV